MFINTWLLISISLLLLSCEKNPTGSEGILAEPIAIEGDGSADDGVTTPTFTEEFMELVNDHRHSRGLGSLINDEDMSELAQAHSDNMASGSTSFGHSGFSSRCAEARSALGGGNLCGENVASGQKTPQSVFTAWMNSSTHRANIEQIRYTHSGFGFKKNANGTYYWTHLFLEKN